MIGSIFNKWTVIKEDKKQSKRGRYWLCQCECGYTKLFTTSYLNTNKATCCEACKYKNRIAEDERLQQKYLGQRFGTWTIIAYTYKTKYGSRTWLCQCDCGNERKFLTSYLYGNGIRKATICKACELNNFKIYKDSIKEIPNRVTTEIPNRFWRKFTGGAARRNIDISVSKDDCFQIYEKQNKKCIYTGIDLYFSKLMAFNNYTNASIDRIDSDESYSLDNIQWVCKKINIMKHVMPHTEFIEMCALVTKTTCGL